MQRLRWLSQRCAHDVPDLSRDRRGIHVHARPRQRHSRRARTARDEATIRCAPQELEDALSNCLSCKACTTECPSNVNLALLKAELIHARYQRDGLPLRVRVISAVDLLGRLGCPLPALANAALDFGPLCASLMEKTSRNFRAADAAALRARERFDKWFVGKHLRHNGRVARTSHSLGRHFCPLSRAAHRHRRGRGARSARL